MLPARAIGVGAVKVWEARYFKMLPKKIIEIEALMAMAANVFVFISLQAASQHRLVGHLPVWSEIILTRGAETSSETGFTYVSVKIGNKTSITTLRVHNLIS